MSHAHTPKPGVLAALNAIVALLTPYPNRSAPLPQTLIRWRAHCRMDCVAQAVTLGVATGLFSVTRVGRATVYTLVTPVGEEGNGNPGNATGNPWVIQGIDYRPEPMRGDEACGNPRVINPGVAVIQGNPLPGVQEAQDQCLTGSVAMKDAALMAGGHVRVALSRDGDVAGPTFPAHDHARNYITSESYLPTTPLLSDAEKQEQGVVALVPTSPSPNPAAAPPIPPETTQPPTLNQRSVNTTTPAPAPDVRVKLLSILATQPTGTLYARWCSAVEAAETGHERLDLLLGLANLCVGLAPIRRNRNALEKMVREVLTDGQPRGILAVARYLTLLANEESISTPLRLLHEVARRREQTELGHQRRYEATSPASLSAATWERARAATPHAEDWIDTSKLVKRNPAW